MEKKKTLSAKLPPETMELLRLICEKHERSQAYIVNKLILELAKKEKVSLPKNT